ncbi:MAG: glutamate synthase [Candidatus Omnitrophica bacterium CG1_02_44_16]|nr:MAG: glutamate synthase [Candidatus Omnitrophica bacterium CG1_02_44_16]PIY83974.1 MAG: glutamate synthase [Candidatus Omnitrophica bacterium CG_4_10_14_0_8_um_filter_44_12]
MGDVKGFLNKKREAAGYRPVGERTRDFREVELLMPETKSQEQGSRCMDCGVPFCHYACPVGNVVPDWNDLLFRGQWRKAVLILQASNNFPEFTGRVCPALCESACVLGINDDPVTIRQNEISIIEWGFKEGVIKPFIPKLKTGKRVAVVGSGPAGLAVSQQLTHAGHDVILFEADDKAGGILRYGIPDFKLEKWVIDRRLGLMKEEGSKIETGVLVGKDLPKEKLLKEFDAVCLTIGSRAARDIDVPGRGLKGIYFAMDYLIQSNKVSQGVKISGDELITAKGKHVVIIGGGDTGSDCVGTANRQRAKSVTQIEVLPKPPLCRANDMPWPTHPKILKTTSSHEEGCVRKWGILTKGFIAENGSVKKLRAVQIDNGMKEILGTEFELEADLVILAMGFTHPEHSGLVADLGLSLSARGAIYVDNNTMTSKAGIFAAGDASRGASLVVWAIYEGRRAAKEIDKYLMGSTDLP